jgi:acyl carrier protein
MVETMTTIHDELKEFITFKFLAGAISDHFNYDTQLLDEQVIDSSGVLILIMHVEKKYMIKIDDNELIPENFNSINLLASLIQQKMSTSRNVEIRG